MQGLIETTMTPVLLDFLRHQGPVAYNLLGAIENVETLKLYVDNLEAPTGVVGKEAYFHYVVTDSKNFIDQMMTSLFSEDGYYGFSGIRKNLDGFILSHEVQEHWRNDCFLYILPDNAVLTPIDPRIEPLTEDDLEEIHSYYEYQSDTSLEDIREDIINRPSACIRIDGDLASWVLVHRDNTMGIMYTKEKYRKHQLAYLTANGLMYKLRSLNIIPYVQIHTSNTASQGLAKKLGLIQAKECVSWFGIVVGDLPLDDD